MNTSGGSALRKVTGLLGLLVGASILLVSLWLLYADISQTHSKVQGLWFMAAVPAVMLIAGAIGTARGSRSLLYVLLCTNTLVLAVGMAGVNGRIVNGGATLVFLFPAALEVCVLALLIINEQKQRDA